MRRLTLSLLACGLLVAGGCATSDTGGSEAGKGGAGGSNSSEGGGQSGGSAGSGGASASAGSSGSAGASGSAGSSGSAGAGGATAGASGNEDPSSGPKAGGGGEPGGVDAMAAAPDTAPTAPPADPNAPCPRCVRIFNGVDFEGWEASSSTWTIVDGAMRGIGGTSRAAYTKKDYGNVRLILTSRMNPINGDHLGVLFWGDRPTDPSRPKIDLAGWLQWMPPNGGMWSYHAPRHRGVSSMRIAQGPGKIDQWHTSEILLNLDKGTLRGATDGVEINRYTHPTPTERMDPTTKIIKGPIGLMRHGRGGSEYKDIWVEEDPIEDKLYTVK